MRNAIIVALATAVIAVSAVIALAGCVPSYECVTSDDCGIGVCVDAECVECAGDNDCDDDEECDDGECEEIDESEGEGEASEGEGEASEGEGEGEASEGEGEGEASEGEGEASEGEGEGEGEPGDFPCGPFWVCDADDRCLSLDDDTSRACFQSCADEGASCDTAWGDSGFCEVVDGALVCVADAPSNGICGSFGNARCGGSEICVQTSEVVSTCFEECEADLACPSGGECFDVIDTSTQICVIVRDIGDTCGVEADGAFTYCDPAVAGCDFTEGISGDCVDIEEIGGEGEGEGEGEGPVLPGSEGEGEGEGPQGPPCLSVVDCNILSFTTGTCEAVTDCGDGSTITPNECAETSDGVGHCVLKSLADPRCDEIPYDHPLVPAGAVSVDNESITFCAIQGVACTQGHCTGGEF